MPRADCPWHPAASRLVKAAQVGERSEADGESAGLAAGTLVNGARSRSSAGVEVDTFPLGTIANRALTIKSGQCHVHRYVPAAPAHRKGRRSIRTMVITHRLPLSDAAEEYEIFLNKEDRCGKVVLSPRQMYSARSSWC